MGSEVTPWGHLPGDGGPRVSQLLSRFPASPLGGLGGVHAPRQEAPAELNCVLLAGTMVTGGGAAVGVRERQGAGGGGPGKVLEERRRREAGVGAGLEPQGPAQSATALSFQGLLGGGPSEVGEGPWC